MKTKEQNIFITKKDIVGRVVECYVFDDEDDNIYKIIFQREGYDMYAFCFNETDSIIKKKKVMHEGQICHHIKDVLVYSANKIGKDIEFVEKNELGLNTKNYTCILQNHSNHSILIRDKVC